MIQKFSDQFTDFLLFKGIIENENREIYAYGFVALFSTVINIIILITIGLITGLLFETIIFMLMFGVLRVYCGGYHAQSNVSCILIFVMFYGLSMAVVKFLPADFHGTFSLILGITSFLIIFLLAPIEHKNKPFIGDEYRKFRIMSIIIAAIELKALCFIIKFFPGSIEVALLISLAMLGVAFILILAKVTEKRR